MSDVAIRIDGLGKKYRIRHQRRERYTALRDVITDKVRGIFRPAPADAAARVEDFWALKDASFEIRRGEATETRPHGLYYSLTLHDPEGQRLIGFDNAHSVAAVGSRFKERPAAADRATFSASRGARRADGD